METVIGIIAGIVGLTMLVIGTVARRLKRRQIIKERLKDIRGG